MKRLRIYAWLLALGGGCAGADEPAVAAPDAGSVVEDDLAMCTAKALRFGACAEVLDSFLANDDISMNGVVTSIASAAFADCPQGVIGELAGASGGILFHLLISDHRTELQVSVRLPWSKPIVRLGQFVNVEYATQTGLRNPADGRLILRNAEGELLLAAMQVTGGFSEIELPELSFTDSEHTCTVQKNGCGMGTRGDIRVMQGSEEVSIRHGSRAEVGDYVVLHGENERFESVPGVCTHSPDYHRVVVAVVRGSEASLGE